MSENSKRYVILTPFKKADVLAGLCKLHGLDVWVVPSKAGAMVVHDLPAPVYDDWDISELLGGVPADAGDGEESTPDSAADATAEADVTEAGDGTNDSEPAASETVSNDPGHESDEESDDVDSDEDGADEQIDVDDQHKVATTLARLSRAGVVVLTSELGEDVGNEVGVSGLVTALSYDSKGKATDTPAGLIVATGEQILEDLLLGVIKPEDAKGAIRSGSINSRFIEGLVQGKKPDAGDALPPRRPRRFFGKDPK